MRKQKLHIFGYRLFKYLPNLFVTGRFHLLWRDSNSVAAALELTIPYGSERPSLQLVGLPDISGLIEVAGSDGKTFNHCDQNGILIIDNAKI